MIDWWQRRPLRFRLAAWYAMGGTVLLAAFSATVYFYVEYNLARPLDHALRRDLKVVRRNLQVSGDGRVLWNGHETREGEPWPATNPWFELWNENGELVKRYWPFVDDRLERLPVAPAPGRETISVFNVSADVRLRVLSVPLGMGGRSDQWMVRVMCIHEPAVNALGALVIIIVIALPVVVLLLVFGGYTLTRRWLKPLDSMVREADLITAIDLSRRLPIDNPHDELGRLASVFNKTLARLEDSFLTLDRFVADASHELLTPLTTLRSVGEVGLRGARTDADYREIIGSMLEESQHLQVLVEKLLQLARAEGGVDMVEAKAIQLDALARECGEDAAVLAEEKKQTIVLRTAMCEIFTDPLLLRQALQNLVDNAIKHGPAGTTITISILPTEEGVEVSVSDDGPGVPPEHEARLTDRFFRADNARGRKGGGFGLGLAITKAYLHVLGGGIRYEALQPHGSRFVLTLPRVIGTSPKFSRPPIT